MALSEIDRTLLERCLQRKPHAWEEFVDRFLGLIVHVVDHTALARNLPINAEDRDDLCAEVLLTLVRNDFSVLRHFRGKSSLATYLTVIARRVVVHEMMKRLPHRPLATYQQTESAHDPGSERLEQRFEDREHIERLLRQLPDREATIVRMYYLEGKSYEEISRATGLAENSIGPVLSRARGRLRTASADQPAV